VHVGRTGMRRQHLLESVDNDLGAAVRRDRDDHRSARALTDVGNRDLHRDQPRDLFALVKATAHQDDRILCEMYAVLLVGLREEQHLDRALEVLETADVVIVPIRPEMAALRAVVALTNYLRDINALGPGTTFVVNHLAPREMVKLRDIESLLGARVAVEIPPDPYIFLKAVNEGIPVVRAAPKSVAAQRLARLAAMTLGESRIVESRASERKSGRRLLSLRGSR